MLSPLLRMEVWTQIRDQFSEEEKAELNRAITGTVLCPRGATIAESRLSAELLRKLNAAVKPHEKWRKRKVKC